MGDMLDQALRQLSTTKEPSSSAFASRLERHGKSLGDDEAEHRRLFHRTGRCATDPRRRIDVTTLVKNSKSIGKPFTTTSTIRPTSLSGSFGRAWLRNCEIGSSIRPNLTTLPRSYTTSTPIFPAMPGFTADARESSIKGLSFAPCAACLMSRANTIGESSASLAISISRVMSSFCSYRFSGQISR